MNCTPTFLDPLSLPEEYREIARGVPVYDSSCSREAKVYFIDRDEGYYLKIAKRGTLGREAIMDKYFFSKKMGAPVLNYSALDRDYLLTGRVVGEDLTHGDYTADGVWLADTMGTLLRSLHETDGGDCPVQDRVAEYLELAKNNYISDNYDKSAFPDSFGYESADWAWAVLAEGKGLLKRDTLIHGDFCLPNIIMNGRQFSGYIDLGNAGIGDRHIDLFWGAWTLLFNLKTDKYRERFLDAYGRDKIDKDILRVVAAAEVFG